MRALSKAIRQAEPLAGLEDSPFRALRRTRARTIDVVAQSVAAAAPAGVLAFHTGAMGDGPYGLVELAVAVPLMLAVGVVLGVFTRRLASTGAVYTFVARGLGARAGIAAGALLAIGYLAVGSSTLLIGGRRLADLVASDRPDVAAVVIIVLTGCGIAALSIGGLRMTTRMLLVFEVGAVATVLAVTAIAVAQSPSGVVQPHWLGEPEAASAVVSVVLGFVGFESGAALGAESRRPHATVPRGVMISIVAIAAVLLAGSVGHLALRSPGSLADAPATRAVLQAIIGVSFLACALAMTTASARLVLAMSREGVLPAALGRVSRRGVPWSASLVLVVPVVTIPCAAVLASVETEFESGANILGPLGFLAAYVLLCAASVAFLVRIGEATPRMVVLASSTGAAQAALLVAWACAMWAREPVAVAVGLSVCLIVVVSAVVLVARTPRLRARVGVYDWVESADAIAGGAR
ncbi:hypothetical protein GCM10022219_21870 [Microbacterium oryzae]|uniref:APC family permease n=1 Tax=Microbacterium oryzae TaxID=743009 RepID=A0A6I6DRM7_9MICO|nr:APC family permease [Microbacterium oryzae]QGU27582.1 APC family permease [Microbacterium oryzae]